MDGMASLDGQPAFLSLLTEPGMLPADTPTFDGNIEAAINLLNKAAPFKGHTTISIRENALFMEDTVIEIDKETRVYGVVLHTATRLIAQFDLQPGETLFAGSTLTVQESARGVLTWQ